MNLDQFIERPIRAIVLNLFIVIFGLVAYQKLPVSQYPDISKPQVTISVAYPGASSEIVETEVTDLLEKHLFGLEGVSKITSSSKYGQSSITITYKPDVEVGDAITDVREKVSRVGQWLPKGTEAPVVTKASSSENPMFWLIFSQENNDLDALSDYVENYVQRQYDLLPGVASAVVFGSLYPSVQIQLDSQQLAAYDLGIADLEQAIQAVSMNFPAGNLRANDRAFEVKLDSRIEDLSTLAALPIPTPSGERVFLSDVATIVFAPDQEELVRIRYDGRPGVAIGIIKQSTANPITVSNAVLDLTDTLSPQLPEGTTVAKAWDQAEDIRHGIQEVFSTIGEAIVLVLLIIFLFLKNLRATFIPGIAIPISLTGIFFVMAQVGVSINLLTLLAMVIAIGLVVDDAIVVLENVHRHIEKGLTPFKAAIVGIQEIRFAILAMTLSLVVVFLPILFAQGDQTRLFSEFAIVLAGTVTISGIVALTLTPALASKLLGTHDPVPPAWLRPFDQLMQAFESFYQRTLPFVLRRPWWVALIVTGILAANYGLWSSLAQEIAPQEDESVILVVQNGPRGADPDFVAPYVDEVSTLLGEVPEGDSKIEVIGMPDSASAFSVLKLKPTRDRSRTQTEIAQSLYPPLSQIPALKAFAWAPPPDIAAHGRGSNELTILLQTTGSYTDLDRNAGTLKSALQEHPFVDSVSLGQSEDHIAYTLTYDQTRANDLGVSPYHLGELLNTLLSGRKIADFHQDAKRYNIRLIGLPDAHESIDDLLDDWVPTASGEHVTLRNFIQAELTTLPGSLQHHDQLRTKYMTLQIKPGTSPSEALEAFRPLLVTHLDHTVQYRYSDAFKAIEAAQQEFFLLSLLAFVFIYLILSVQFNSFADPLVILLSAPLAFFGGLLFLKAIGGTMNLYSQIGLISLIGLITKHGIMIVEFANQRLSALSPEMAVIEATRIRFRPILMTTFATILGALPLLLANGVGAVSRSHIGSLIVGGMLIGTLFTLYLVPSFYLFIRRHLHPTRV